MAVNSRIGIDLGGTKIEGAVLNAQGDIVTRQRIATPADDYDAICAAVTQLVLTLERESRSAATVGVGMPGSVSPATGLVKNANTVCLIGTRFGADLETSLARPIRLENDANCFVLSEVNGGIADGYDSVFGVIIGSGTGGGLYLNGRVVTGANAIGGEWGHNPVPWTVLPEARRACYCGKQNCVETFLSGPGLLRTFIERGGVGASTIEAVVVAKDAGNVVACEVLADYAGQLAECLAVVINVVDPSAVVLGGGLSNLPNLCREVAAALPTTVFSDSVQTRILRARFGDSSGVRGAANLWPAEISTDV